MPCVVPADNCGAVLVPLDKENIMSPETFYKLAPFSVAIGTFFYGIFATDAHPVLVAVIATGFGTAYDWLDRKFA